MHGVSASLEKDGGDSESLSGSARDRASTSMFRFRGGRNPGAREPVEPVVALEHLSGLLIFDILFLEIGYGGKQGRMNGVVSLSTGRCVVRSRGVELRMCRRERGRHNMVTCDMVSTIATGAGGPGNYELRGLR